jgi:hypothetical protein
MGHRHFVDCNTGHALVADFRPYDCWFWHDTSAGHPTPLLATVLDPPPAGWTTILESGNGSWATAWKPVPAVAETRVGQGTVRICQVKLANRMATNPAAALLARRLLGLEDSGPEAELEAVSGQRATVPKEFSVPDEPPPARSPALEEDHLVFQAVRAAETPPSS